MKNIVREELVEWISKPENEDLLDTLRLMKEAEESGDWLDKLTKEEIQSIEKGLREHEEGSTLSSKEFWEKHA
ncbi:hypothetical protein [Gracilimonas sp.]|uniref:hypothetical protein n=1 Tax=Gracilimonas sp. TaxID=1974203 RepID=UPI003BABE974